MLFVPVAKIIKAFHIARKAEILSVFSFTAISTLVKMLTSFITVKVVAVVIGPTGIALLGQLNNFTNILLSVASGGINNGITKHIAENKDAPRKIQLFLSTALHITLILSVFCGLSLILFASTLSRLILSDVKYSYVFILFGISITLYTLNSFILSVLNGYKDFKKFINISIVTSLVGALFTVGLVWVWNLKGALISVVTYQSVVFFITLFMVAKSKWLTIINFNKHFSRAVLKKYLGYSLMTLVTAATVPVSQLLIRSYVITNLSLNEAGWLEAINRISGMYLMVITSSFGVYYLPRLSEIKDKKELKKEIFTAYKVIIPLITIGFTLIYFGRDIIIRILFTKEFYPMRDLFVWQLTGDIFKISSWLLAYLMIAKSMTKQYILIEIIFCSTFVALSIFLVRLNGLEGVPQAYMINYFISFITLIIIFRKLIFGTSKH